MIRLKKTVLTKTVLKKDCPHILLLDSQNPGTASYILTQLIKRKRYRNEGFPFCEP